MYTSRAESVEPIADFKLDGTAIRYSNFVPRLYNLCLELGMERGKIMPSRAFCSDENQGYPIILIARHFGTFPFNHGQVGGIVATDRHGPHAHHGKDIVIIQASHVGYDPEIGKFGIYRRLQTENQESSASCGKICGVMSWYQEEYVFAQQHTLLQYRDGKLEITIDNQLLKLDRKEGLFLNLKKLIAHTPEDEPIYIRSLSTAKTFQASALLQERVADRIKAGDKPCSIGNALAYDLFYFRRNISDDIEGREHLEQNLIQYAPRIITSSSVALNAAIANTQVEFDRTYRSLVKEHAYQGKRVLFVSGLNIDVSPAQGMIFPLTKFVPWAAYVQEPDGSGYTLEQEELLQQILKQSPENPDHIDLESAIHSMEDVQEVKLKLPY